MNRISSYAALIEQVRNAPEPKAEHEAWDTSAIRELTTHYRLLGPVGYEKNYAYPLVIWLHGPGDDERQVVNIMREVSLQNYVAIGLRGTFAEPTGNSYNWSLDDYSVDRAQRQVHDCLAMAREKYHIHPQRIFLAGLHVGGTLALRLALCEPELYAGVASIGGCFPSGSRALLRYRAAQDLPLLIMRGLESATYTEQIFCDELRLFHAARLRVHCRQYLTGDDLTVPMLKDLNGWLMEQVTGNSILDIHDSPAGYSSGS